MREQGYSNWVKSRQCGNKIQYQSEMLAQNMRILLSWVDEDFLQLEAYLCPWSLVDSTHWHLGHPNRGTLGFVVDEV